MSTSHFPSYLPFQRHRAFTLIELLAVIGVIAMILAFTAPLVGNAGVGRKLVNGGNAMTNTVEYARQLAKSENRLSALVLITEEVGGETVSRRFTVLQQAADRASWKQVSRWEVLPEGIVVDASESKDFFESRPTVNPALPNLRHGTTNYTVADYAYQIFLPVGGILTDSPEPPEISLRSFPRAAAADNFFNIIINPSTGTTVIRRP